LLIRRDVKFNDFEYDKRITEDEMRILYEEESWNQYAFPIRNFAEELENEVEVEEQNYYEDSLPPMESIDEGKFEDDPVPDIEVNEDEFINEPSEDHHEEEEVQEKESTDVEESAVKGYNDPPQSQIDNMRVAHEIDLKVRPVKRFNYPDSWFRRETRSQSQQQYAAINHVLSKRPSNPRDIDT
jgi:hypothetical protein